MRLPAAGTGKSFKARAHACAAASANFTRIIKASNTAAPYQQRTPLFLCSAAWSHSIPARSFSSVSTRPAGRGAARDRCGVEEGMMRGPETFLLEVSGRNADAHRRRGSLCPRTHGRRRSDEIRTSHTRIIGKILGSDGLRRIKHKRSLASRDQPIWKAVHRLWEAIENAAG
jgi:hypothetical protein